MYGHGKNYRETSQPQRPGLTCSEYFKQEGWHERWELDWGISSSIINSVAGFFPNEGHNSFINLHITICPGQCEIHLPTGNQAWPAEKTLRMKMLMWSMNRGFPFQRLNTVPEGALLSPLESWINLRWGHGSKSRRSEPQCACISILGSAVPVLRCIEWQVSKDG